MVTWPWRDPRTVGLAVATAAFMVGAVSVARVDQAARDKAFTTMIGHTPLLRRTVTATADPVTFLVTAQADSASRLAEDESWIRGQIAGTVPLASGDDGRPAWGQIVTPPVPLAKAAPSALASPQSQAFVQVRYRQGASENATLLAGRWPDTEEDVPGGLTRLSVAVTPATMSRFGLALGSVVALGTAPETDLRIVGVYEPRDADGVYWQDDPLSVAPQIQRPLGLPPYWTGGALLGPDETVTAVQLLGVDGVRLNWTFALDTAGYGAGDAARLDRALAEGLQVSPDALDDHPELSAFTMSTGLTPTVEAFLNGQRVERYETTVPEASLAVIGLVALGLLARSALRRREAEFELLLARGVGVASVALRLVGAGLVVVAPMAAAAFVIGRALPGGAAPMPTAWVLAPPAVAILAPAGMALLRYRGRRAVDPSRMRRAVAASVTAGLCLAELQQVRTHGLSAGDGVDLFEACAPVCAAALASMLTLGLAPTVLGWLVRAARRRRGAVALLAPARTARSPEHAAATVFTLTLTVTTLDLVLALRRAAPLTGADAMPGPLRDAASGTLLLLGTVASAAACVIVALAAAGDPVEQAATAARLGAMGLTAGQARAVALAEACGPVGLAVLGATAAAPPLVWILRPGLAVALGGVGMNAWMLALPAAVIAPCAVLAAVGGAAAARRGMLASLRLGDAGGGSR